jgi:hypothetical protein
MLTITSLKHPTMVRKIRMAMQYACMGHGHKMNGHKNRVYIQNAKGRNIMRLDWIGGKAGYIVYGEESRNITSTIKQALQEVHTRDMAPVMKAANTIVAFERAKPASKSWPKIGAVVTLGALLTGCNAPGLITSTLAGLASMLC